MGHGYKAVQWTPFKKVYDLWLGLGLFAFLATFITVTFATSPRGENWSEVQVVMRAFGVTAFALLHLVLAIGPLARLSPRFKPFLYNRRHMGVATFLLALVHAALAILWYSGFSQTNALIALFASNPRYGSIQGFPFESLGFAALMVLLVMAATSHDFWNANLGPRLWKTLHMFVYAAYALLVAHVMLGVIQYERDILFPLVTGAGAVTLVTLHLATGLREQTRDRRTVAPDGAWVRVGAARDIPDMRATIVSLRNGERVAVFRYDGKIAAVSNACRHQNGPLGEGRVIDGCITCPWHGFQYRPEDGCSPVPFTEKIATYNVKIENGIVFLDPTPLAPGTPRAVAVMDETEAAS